MKKFLKKLNLVVLLSCTSFIVFGQGVGHQIKASIRTNGTPGQVDVYLKADFSSSTDYFSNIVIAFALPTSKVTDSTKVTMVNSQIANLAVGTYAQQPRQIVGSNTHFPFTSNNAGTTIVAFTTTEFKLGTFKFSDSTMNMANISLVDFAGGNPGGWLSFYAEMPMEGVVSSNSASEKFYDGGGSTVGGSGTSYYVTTNSTVVLPINLLSFIAAKAGTGVNLNWAVSSEINAKGYEVERSTGNGAAFSVIGNVAATGASNYSIIDASPLSGVSYYRLKMVDNDGQYKYSAVRTVLFDGKAVLFDVYPNPVTTNKIVLSLQQYNYEGKAQAVVTDIAGRSIQTTTINIVKGNNVLPLTVKSLASGTYFVGVYNANGELITANKKIVKQ